MRQSSSVTPGEAWRLVAVALSQHSPEFLVPAPGWKLAKRQAGLAVQMDA